MNYLAHLTLSHFSAELQVGNYLADIVKGRAATELPPQIYRGILMHRAIDRLTDADEGVQAVNRRLAERHGRYAAVIGDIALDYHLYRNWTLLGPPLPFAAFTSLTYQRLLGAVPLLPRRPQDFIKQMTAGDWLHMYTDRRNLRRVFARLLPRLSRPELLRGVNESLVEHDEQLNRALLGLFPRLQQLAETYREPAAPDRPTP